MGILHDAIRQFFLPNPIRLIREDDFIWGSSSSGLIGELGWLSSGTISVVGGSGVNQGVYRLDTSSVSGTHTRISMATSASFDPALTYTIRWIAKLNTNDANTTIRLGAANSVAGAPPNHGIYFEKLDNDTNWFCVTRATSSETRTDSGIAVSTSYAEFKLIRTSAGVRFYINDTLVATHTATIPTVFLAVYAYIINSAAASKTVDVDYASLVLTGIAR